MKDKNRFSGLLKHLMNIAKLKNYTLAKELQYDESYISKWVTGALIPAEKNSENIFRGISHCVVKSLDEESRAILYADYQVDQEEDLEEAVFDNLKAEYDYVINLKESTGSDVVQETVFYPELTLVQFLKKMHHPILRQVKSLSVIMATDILALDRSYQLALTELDTDTNVNVTQRSYPGVRFSMLINLDSPNTDNTYNVQFIQSLLTNLTNVDFQLYSSSRSQGKILFAVKDAYLITGMIMDENHCLSVTTSEEPKNCNAIYDRLQSLCNQETLVIRRTNLSQMMRSNEYMQYIFSRNQRWVFNHVTEYFLVDEIFEELADEYCNLHRDVERTSLMQIHKLASSVFESMKIQLLLSESGITDFAVNGAIDFLGTKIQLEPRRRLQCLEYVESMTGKNPNFEIRILQIGNALNLHHIPAPTLFLSDSICYLRIIRNGSTNNLSVLNCPQICNMFRKYFDDLWRDETCVDSNYSRTADIIRYAKQMVQVQILIE